MSLGLGLDLDRDGLRQAQTHTPMGHSTDVTHFSSIQCCRTSEIAFQLKIMPSPIFLNVYVGAQSVSLILFLLSVL